VSGRSRRGTSASESVATYEARFSPRRRADTEPPRPDLVCRLPRVTRLLVLAHRVDDMIRAGEIRDWADAARVMGVTRARMTQIANLLLLAPPIQESILNLSPAIRDHDAVTEHALREVAAHADWHRQDATSLEPKH